MAALVPTKFSSYILSQEEELRGRILSIDQKYVIQNTLSDYASDLVNLDFDPENPLEFAKKQAYCKGAMDVLSYILDISEANLQEMQNLADQPA